MMSEFRFKGKVGWKGNGEGSPKLCVGNASILHLLGAFDGQEVEIVVKVKEGA